MKAELDEVLEGLPRTPETLPPKTVPNAWVYLDASGALCIIPVDGGWLRLEERKLGHLQADAEPFHE